MNSDCFGRDELDEFVKPESSLNLELYSYVASLNSEIEKKNVFFRSLQSHITLFLHS